MAKDLKGTRTEQDLWAAFAGESQARNKYNYYAAAARKEGYQQIAGFFEETAENEKEHAKRLGKFLGIVKDTKANLADAAAGERHEYTSMYPEFARVAREEGFPEIAQVFTEIGEVEEFHEQRYLRLLANIEQDKVFRRDEEVRWHCRNCGYIHTGREAPDVCPACAHPKAFYELWAEMY